MVTIGGDEAGVHVRSAHGPMPSGQRRARPANPCEDPWSHTDEPLGRDTDGGVGHRLNHYEPDACGRHGGPPQGIHPGKAERMHDTGRHNDQHAMPHRGNDELRSGDPTRTATMLLASPLTPIIPADNASWTRPPRVPVHRPTTGPLAKAAKTTTTSTRSNRRPGAGHKGYKRGLAQPRHDQGNADARRRHSLSASRGLNASSVHDDEDVLQLREVHGWRYLDRLVQPDTRGNIGDRADGKALRVDAVDA